MMFNYSGISDCSNSHSTQIHNNVFSATLTYRDSLYLPDRKIDRL
ncbi:MULTISPECIES: hypothetical protein [unclassified Microcoleus]|nr:MULTISPECIES: hypothetical protein [unclassified Microcoleus]